jgi:hypothetical protein
MSSDPSRIRQALCRLGMATVTTLTALSLAPGPVAAATTAAAPPIRSEAQIDAELRDDLIGWALRLSGRLIRPAGPPPSLAGLPPAELSRRVCGDDARQCHGLVAAYGTELRDILYRDTLDLRDPTDQSFIVHELVHWLQHAEQGDAVEAGCAAVLANETEAYRVQNEYLARFRQWQRVGEILRFTHCPDDQSAAPAVRYDGATRSHPMASPPAHPRAFEPSE